MAVHGQDSGTSVVTLIGHQQICGYGHGVLGVKDHPVSPVAIAGHALGHLEIKTHPLWLLTEQFLDSETAALTPRFELRPVLFGKRVDRLNAAQSAHPLGPRRKITRASAWLFYHHGRSPSHWLPVHRRPSGNCFVALCSRFSKIQLK